jgi:hypothetical protein
LNENFSQSQEQLLQKNAIERGRLMKRKHQQEKSKGNDTRTRLPGMRKGRTGAVAIGGNAAQIQMEEVTPSVALPTRTGAECQSERIQP